MMFPFNLQNTSTDLCGNDNSRCDTLECQDPKNDSFWGYDNFWRYYFMLIITANSYLWCLKIMWPKLLQMKEEFWLAFCHEICLEKQTTILIFHKNYIFREILCFFTSLWGPLDGFVEFDVEFIFTKRRPQKM